MILCAVKLLYGNNRAGSLDLSLDRFGLFLGNAGLYGLRSADDKILGLAERQTRNVLDFLYDLQLLGFLKAGEFYVKFGLLLSGGSCGGSTGSCGYGNGSGGNT